MATIFNLPLIQAAVLYQYFLSQERDIKIFYKLYNVSFQIFTNGRIWTLSIKSFIKWVN